MSKPQIHFGWFAGNGYGPLGWDSPMAAPYDFRDGAVLFQKMAQICEAGKFDYVLFADQVGIPMVYRGNNETYIKHGNEIYQDTSMVAASIGAATTHVGIGTTVSTGLMPPYMLARQVMSLDHLTGGRVAWNVVTTANIAGFLNVGIRELPPHNSRYDAADEYMELVRQLWASWEPDAVVMDREAGVFGDPAKVHPVSFSGERFTYEGLPAAPQSPRGRPAIIQAGSSDRGQEYAARWADAVITGGGNVDNMKRFHDSLKGKMEKYGRKPDDLKIFFNVHPIVAESIEIADLKNQPYDVPEEVSVPAGLAILGQRIGHDLEPYDLDKPLPASEKPWESRTAFTSLFTGNGPTLRELAVRAYSKRDPSAILGNPEEVADKMEQMIDAVGGDGFNITCDSYNHAFMLDFVSGVIPVLQKRGRARAEYTSTTLRGHLAEM